jgi:hypothetical protein
MDWHPYARSYPLLDGDDRASFRADIGKRGLQEPIKYRMIGGQKQGLDGRNRKRECEELGIECSELCVHVPDEEVEAYIDSLNLHRRHLTGEARRTRVIFMRANGMSGRQIAELLHIGEGTVRRDLEKAQEESDSTAPNGAVETPELPDTVTGKDGKRRAASTKPKILCDRCQRTGPVKNCEACKEARKASKAAPPAASDADETQLVDDVSVPIPEHCREAFVVADALTKICRELNDIKARVESISKGAGGRLVNYESWKQHLANTKGHLWANRATHVCGYCHGEKRPAKEKCEACKGEGWTNKATWEQCPDQQNAKGRKGK